MKGSSASVSQATVDIGRVFVEGGFLGLVIYAVLLAFFLLLVRDFLKDYLIRSIQREQSATNKEVAESMRMMAVQLSLMHSALDMNTFHRARDKGQLPRGAVE